VGLCGVIVMLRPQASSMMTLGAVAALGAATCYAMSVITVRMLTRTDTTASIVFWIMAQLTVYSGLLALPAWQPIRPEDWWPLVGIGITGAIAQRLITEAFRLAPASTIAPFEYTALLYGVAIDYTIWNVLPSSRMYLGAGIIIASGLYLVWRERQLAMQSLQPSSAV
jgi:drug/metabolite transporter (DMT)-like permease